MEKMTELDYKIHEMAARIKELRQIVGLSTAQMAEKTDVTESEYIDAENGKTDLNFAFIYRCAGAFGVDVTDIIEGHSPTLRSYTLTRKGAGQRIDQRHMVFRLHVFRAADDMGRSMICMRNLPRIGCVPAAGQCCFQDLKAAFPAAVPSVES